MNSSEFEKSGKGLKELLDYCDINSLDCKIEFFAGRNIFCVEIMKENKIHFYDEREGIFQGVLDSLTFENKLRLKIDELWGSSRVPEFTRIPMPGFREELLKWCIKQETKRKKKYKRNRAKKLRRINRYK